MLPIGKVEPDDGLQTTPLPPSSGLIPQAPEVVGAAKVTMALHWLVLTGATDGQLMVQVDVELTTVLEADAELSGARSSLVALEILAVFEMTEPFGRVALTLKVKVNTAIEFAGNDARVQLIVPLLLPVEGVVQVKVRPESCTSETKVVLPGTELVSTTICAASGPLLVTSTR